ncbi:hypothetical protein SAMN05421827_109119 [Pedobacter terrae]|uniref:Uncharacterized protein n=1 Tax=Pedobacter terrae TaxID=405671 RepID=A0A1G7W6M0_9SPHI|nr:hypothetical protein SAMN05421827_109119 [Pedobacter terrae]
MKEIYNYFVDGSISDVIIGVLALGFLIRFLYEVIANHD